MHTFSLKTFLVELAFDTGVLESLDGFSLEAKQHIKDDIWGKQTSTIDSKFSHSTEMFFTDFYILFLRLLYLCVILIIS